MGTGDASMMAWRSLLADLGSKLPMPVAMRIFFLGQLGKYLPGSVWTVVAQADLGRDHSIPPRRTVAASVVGMGISLAAGLVLAIVTLPFSAPGEAVHYAWVLLVLPLLVIGLLPKNVDRLTRLLLKVLRREPPDHAFTWRGVVVALGWQTSSWIAIGGEVFVLCWALHAPITRTLPLALGATALAWSAGFLAVPLPSGAGLRELITIAMLSSVLSRLVPMPRRHRPHRLPRDLRPDSVCVRPAGLCRGGSVPANVASGGHQCGYRAKSFG